jgi:hypothetical protein
LCLMCQHETKKSTGARIAQDKCYTSIIQTTTPPAAGTFSPREIRLR